MFCNVYLREIVEFVKCGVIEVGGFFLEFLVIFMGEINMCFMVMFFCNMGVMDMEECIRVYLMDGVVLFIGCDKIIFVIVMGVCSVDFFMIVVFGGFMLNGYYCGELIGFGIFVWKLKDKLKNEDFI